MLTLAVVTAKAQSKVTGTVIDENGDPIIGATVRVDGTQNGVSTDLEGKFNIEVPAKGKLRISYIGYTTQVISEVSKMKRIALKPDNMNLDEVVVVGYGYQKQRNVTGSVEVVDMKDIEDLSVTNLGDALAGMVNGLNVTSSGNKPGSSATLTIRQSSALAKNNGQVNSKFSSQDDSPLFIIDGFFSSESAFNALDVSEVESISVLKDAAAAIYGAQGAYGVVLVTTKRGKVGAPKVSYTGQFGITDALVMPKMMSAYEYGRTWNGYKGTPDYSSGEINLTRQLFQADELEAMKSLDYNLLDDEWSAAMTQRHSLNISGGSEKATYFVGVSYNTQDGNIGKLDYNRWNYRAGANINVNKWIKASMQVSGHFGYSKKPMNKYGSSDSGDYNLLLTHLRHVPETINGRPVVYQGMDEDNTVSGDNLYNFYAIQNATDYSKSDNNGFTIDGSVDIDMGFWKPLQGLKFRATYSKSVSNSKSSSVATKMDIYTMSHRAGSGRHLYSGLMDDGLTEVDYSLDNFQLYSLDNGNYISRSSSRSDSYQLNVSAIYERQFGKHNVSALFSIERGESESEDLEGKILSPLSTTDGQSNSGTGTQTTEWGRSEGARMSYIGRVNYSYADKYLFEFLVRSDASTKFAPSNYWGTFPSVSAGWVMSEEKWFNKEKLGIDFLKLRASWGLLGRDNINSFVWLTRYNRTEGRGSLFGSSSLGNNVSAGMVIEQGGSNPDAHWDKTYKTNVGLDMRLLKGRLSVKFDYYYDKGREIFGSHQGTKYFPMTVGIKPVPENFVEKDVWGGEISIGWRDKIGKDFTYWVKFNTGWDDDEVRKMAVKETPGLTDPTPGHRQDTGLWGLECMGMFRSYQEIDEYFAKYNITDYLGMSKEAVRPGMLIYKDNGGAWDPVTRTYGAPDGVVSSDDTQGDYVRISKRSENPYSFTVNFGASYKDFSIQAQFGASWGAKVMAGTNIRKAASSLEYNNIPAFWSDMFVYEDVLDAKGYVVAEANRDAVYPNIQYENVNNLQSTFWALDGTMISLRNISMAYTLPKRLLRYVRIESCRINVTCQNAINFKSPHISDAWSSWGGNYGYYPNLRKWTIGLNITF